MTGRESSFKSIPSCSHILFKFLKHDSGDTFSRFQPREEIHGKSRFPGLTSDLRRQLHKRRPRWRWRVPVVSPTPADTWASARPGPHSCPETGGEVLAPLVGKGAVRTP